MADIRQYVLSVIAAAMICGIIGRILGKSGSCVGIIKLLTSLILAIAVISPWIHFEFQGLSDYTDKLTQDANDLVQQGERLASDSTAAIIKSRSEAYILDKAALMDLDIEVEVTISSTTPPIPIAISVTGEVSPYAKESLKHCIATNLGIPEENQLWI